MPTRAMDPLRETVACRDGILDQTYLESAFAQPIRCSSQAEAHLLGTGFLSGRNAFSERLEKERGILKLGCGPQRDAIGHFVPHGLHVRSPFCLLSPYEEGHA